MTRTAWSIAKLKTHTISVDHGFWSGKAIICVDGREIFRRPSKLWDTGLEHRFEIDGAPCIVRVILRVVSFSFELWVDGKPK